MATVSESGWPYVQHRGGPPGFIRILDDRTLAIPDFRGNRQYISTGNPAANDRAGLIFMDYPKTVLVFADVCPCRGEEFADRSSAGREVDPARLPGEGRTRNLVLHLAAFDWNGPQHITPRFSEAELSAFLAPLRSRLEALESREQGAARAVNLPPRRLRVETADRPPLPPFTPELAVQKVRLAEYAWNSRVPGAGLAGLY